MRPAALIETAPAKVNLSLRVLGRRPDGYHELVSLVTFAACGDRVSLLPGRELALNVSGPQAAQIGDNADNLVLKAARALAERLPSVSLGTFDLDKRLPVAAGLGGGSADAAAALRLLARANNLATADMRLYEAARATGADVPVCLECRPRLMAGIGDRLSEPLDLPRLDAVLVNPGVPLSTKLVFAGWTGAAALVPADFAVPPKLGKEQLFDYLATEPNDLEAAAMKLAPVVADAIAALRGLRGCRLARMSGSGATCFGLFVTAAEAEAAASALRRTYPSWWIQPTALG